MGNLINHEIALSHVTTQPAWVRITHWINALAIVLMVMSGWQVYDASPIFSFLRFPSAITLGDWLGGALLWHFAIMWLLVVNFLAYLGMNLASGRLRRKLLPISFRSIATDLVAALRGTLGHEDLTRYNAVQKLAYLVVIVDIVFVILSGLAIWKSVQFPLLRLLMGGYDNARVVHFFAMSVLVAFFVVHVVMIALVPRSLLLMIRGR
ncbi:cytochrome b/b6 domain-containing protein [Paraburkholderia panacisoli]|uniref:Cytochrome b/b6 domain-containing protein n=1 Tax=Paraburkholderia panacisoli TaxID=2603818 RepID=A0A5B0GLT9_9BURK|nr:cytochrome b/b6 domain-containing protein [Paraburkholderia panacisoli]KAA1003765.1 cytochrome b/b6 domain-containing protein [Paraburkholderia panacisoli]